MKRRENDSITYCEPGPNDYGQHYSAMPKKSSSSGEAHSDKREEAVSQDDRAYRALWRAVMLQQIQDAKCRRTRREYQNWRRQALSWLFEDEEDFTLVCQMGGLDPDFMRQRLVEAQKNNFRFYENEVIQPINAMAKLGINRKKKRYSMSEDERQQFAWEFNLKPADTRHKKRNRHKSQRVTGFINQMELHF
jgi:hypothetical protein